MHRDTKGKLDDDCPECIAHQERKAKQDALSDMLRSGEAEDDGAIAMMRRARAFVFRSGQPVIKQA